MNIKIVQLEPKQALAIHDNCSAAELGNKFSEISAYLERNSIQIAGVPFGIYHSYSFNNVDLEAGIPVSGIQNAEGRIMVMHTYSGKAFMTAFTGPYIKLHEAWGEFARLVDPVNHKLAGPCFEAYITDREVETDDRKWITELYTPIE